MKTKLASVLGLAVLVASLTCGSSFVSADELEAAPAAVQTLAADANATANAVESVDKLPCESACINAENRTGDVETTEAGGSPTVVSETEPSTVEESPAVRSADAIIVEVTQTVTIVVPGEDAAVSEEPAITGSVQEPVAAEPVVEATEASPAPTTDDAVVAEVVQTVTIAARGQDADDREVAAATGSSPEPTAMEPAAVAETELP